MVAVVLGSALLLIRVTGASVDTRTIVVLLLLFGLPVVALVIALVWSDLFDSFRGTSPPDRRGYTGEYASA